MAKHYPTFEISRVSKQMAVAAVHETQVVRSIILVCSNIYHLRPQPIPNSCILSSMFLVQISDHILNLGIFSSSAVFPFFPLQLRERIITHYHFHWNNFSLMQLGCEHHSTIMIYCHHNVQNSTHPEHLIQS